MTKGQEIAKDISLALESYKGMVDYKAITVKAIDGAIRPLITQLKLDREVFRERINPGPEGETLWQRKVHQIDELLKHYPDV